MKNVINTRKLLALLLAIVMVMGLMACSQKAPDATPNATPDAPATDAPDAPAEADVEPAPAESEEPIVLTLWACNSMIDPAEYKLPEDQWYISGAIKRFEQLHPNVTIEMAVRKNPRLEILPLCLLPAFHYFHGDGGLSLADPV